MSLKYKLGMALIIALGFLMPALAAPFGAGTSAAPPSASIWNWILIQQAQFYRELSLAVRSVKQDGAALGGLLSIAFAYGVFHAAGPGHGKAVISSYLLASEQAFRRGIILSFASAMLQALVAISIVSLAALVLGATSQAIGQSVRWIELAAYSAVTALGLWLIWTKGKRLIHLLKHHGKTHECDASCGHIITPSQVPDWKTGLGAIISSGSRPCSGAILVLTFALAQGVFWAGIGAAFAMALGTAITVSVIATLALSAKKLAAWLAQKRNGPGILIFPLLECAGAIFIFLLGCALLSGFLASENLGF